MYRASLHSSQFLGWKPQKTDGKSLTKCVISRKHHPKVSFDALWVPKNELQTLNKSRFAHIHHKHRAWQAVGACPAHASFACLQNQPFNSFLSHILIRRLPFTFGTGNVWSLCFGGHFHFRMKTLIIFSPLVVRNRSWDGCKIWVITLSLRYSLHMLLAISFVWLLEASTHGDSFGIYPLRTANGCFEPPIVRSS